MPVDSICNREWEKSDIISIVSSFQCIPFRIERLTKRSCWFRCSQSFHSGDDCSSCKSASGNLVSSLRRTSSHKISFGGTENSWLKNSAAAVCDRRGTMTVQRRRLVKPLTFILNLLILISINLLERGSYLMISFGCLEPLSQHC